VDTQTPSCWLAYITGVAALGGFLFGYDTAVIAGAVGALRDHWVVAAQRPRQRRATSGRAAVTAGTSPAAARTLTAVPGAARALCT